MNRHVLCSKALRVIVPTLLLGGLSLQASIAVPSSLTFTSGNGLTTNYDFASVTSSVGMAGNDMLRYTYEIEYGPSQSGVNPSLSHFIINLSNAVLGGLPACGVDPQCFVDFTITGATGTPVFGTYSDAQGNSNPNLPGPVYGVKIDNMNPVHVNNMADITISFLSNRIPVEGLVYGKGARDGYFFSANAIVPDTEIWQDPGDPNPVPEPGTYALLGAGLVGMHLLSRRKK